MSSFKPFYILVASLKEMPKMPKVEESLRSIINNIFEFLDLPLPSGIHANSTARAAGLRKTGRSPRHLSHQPIFCPFRRR
jgi:hypothetical protein